MSAPSGSREARLLAMFAGEVADRTLLLEEGLLALLDLPIGQRQPVLDGIARAVHTLKGSAGMVGRPEIATICHRFEDDLTRLSDARIDPALVRHLLDEVDRLRTRVPDSGPPPSPRDASGAPTVPPYPEDLPGRDSVRIAAGKLDGLVSGVAELRAATSALAILPDQDRRLRPILRGVDRAVTSIDHAVRAAVTVPVTEACGGLARAVHDIADARGKVIDLSLPTGSTELDRRAVDVVRDALVHLVRNAADHGIEGPTERERAGKPTRGRIVLTASLEGDRVAVTVDDDGRGIDVEAVRSAAVDAGITPDTDVRELVFESGVSTATETSEVSGRGVGLDAVRNRVESLGGSISVRSETGVGTAITLKVPTSVSTASVLLVDVGDERIALLTAAVSRLVRVHPEAVISTDRGALLRDLDEVMPLSSLAQAVGYPADDVGLDRPRPAVVVTTVSGRRTALLVDDVVGEEQLMIQPLGRWRKATPGLVGAGTLASGRLVLLLHPAAVVRAARLRPPPVAAAARPTRSPTLRRVLLVEDSPTTRALEQGILEAAGYVVLTANDGRQAWGLLRTERVDVVVSDVEMPAMDGLELCRRIRASSALQELPVVLLTSRDAEDDRLRGADAGADAYLVKSSFAQGELLDTIARLAA